jgi:cation transport regulator ChaB
MPYSKESKNLPKAVKALSEAEQGVWIAAFNACWERYKDLPDAEREQKCFSIAFAAVKKAGDGAKLAEELMADEDDGVQEEGESGEEDPLILDFAAQDTTHLVTLAILSEDLVSADEVERVSHVEVARVGEYVDANGKNISITVERLDDMVRNFEAQAAGQDVPIDVQHEKREAGGWLKRLWRDGKLLMAEVSWNRLGSQLVGDRVYRYLSASIAMPDWVLRSISLVNFPAIKGLAPVQLSEWLLSQPYPTLSQVIPQNVSKRAGPRVSQHVAPIGSARQRPPSARTSQHTGGKDMPNDTELQEGPVAETVNLDAEMAAFKAALSQAKTDAVAQLSEQIVAELAAKRTEMLTELRQEMEDERQLSEFVASTSRGAHALPIREDDLRAVLSELPRTQRVKVIDLFAKITQAGTVDMRELGTSAAKTDKRLLDPAVGAILKAHLQHGDLQTFFAANEELGKPEDYDLTEYGGKHG